MSYQVYKEYLDHYYGEMDQNKTYVVAYISLHVGALEQKLVYAKSELQAANVFLESEYASMQEVHDFMEASDSWINVLEINNTLTE